MLSQDRGLDTDRYDRQGHRQVVGQPRDLADLDTRRQLYLELNDGGPHHDMGDRRLHAEILQRIDDDLRLLVGQLQGIALVTILDGRTKEIQRRGKRPGTEAPTILVLGQNHIRKDLLDGGVPAVRPFLRLCMRIIGRGGEPFANLPRALLGANLRGAGHLDDPLSPLHRLILERLGNLPSRPLPFFLFFLLRRLRGLRGGKVHQLLQRRAANRRTFLGPDLPSGRRRDIEFPGLEGFQQMIQDLDRRLLRRIHRCFYWPFRNGPVTLEIRSGPRFFGLVNLNSLIRLLRIRLTRFIGSGLFRFGSGYGGLG